MKKFEPTLQQKESFKGMYFISDGAIVSLDDSNTEVTAENFKALWIDGENDIQELTVDDFSYYDDNKDSFKFAEFYAVYRNLMPEDVVKLIKEAIENRKIGK